MRQDFVNNHGCVVPYKDMFYANRRHLQNDIIRCETMKGTGPTSAIIIRRNAFAIDASTPTISKSTECCERRCTLTFKFCPYDTVSFRKVLGKLVGFDVPFEILQDPKSGLRQGNVQENPG